MKLLTIIIAASMPALAAAQPPARVAVARAELRKLPSTLRLVGTVEPWLRSVIGSEVAGLVQELPVRQGDLVQKGAVLCKLKDDTLSAELHSAQARLEALNSRLEELSSGTREEEIARLRAEHAEAKAVYDRWNSERQRISTLQKQGQANEKEIYETEAEFRAAEQRMLAAQARYEEAVHGPRREVIAQARFDVAQQEAVVERHRRDVEHTTIRAPFTGYIARLDTEVGQWVERGGRILELIELDRVLVRIDVPEAAIAFAKVGAPAGVLVEAISEEFEGTIRHVIPQADVMARTFPVQIELPNPDGRLKSGMIAWATVISGPEADMVAVPSDAVDLRGGIPYVCVVSDGPTGKMATPTKVTTGANVQDWVAITSRNVPPDTLVVARGNEDILFPMPVEVTNPPSSSETSPPGGTSSQ